MIQREIDIAAIRINGDTQPRDAIDEAAVGEYAEAMRQGETFPPIDVFDDGAALWLADGFHRFHAARAAGLATLPATIHTGTRRDARLFSVGTNASHGLRRTNADKRKAVMTLLADAEWRTWSDSEIARRCAVTRQFVSTVRVERVGGATIAPPPNQAIDIPREAQRQVDKIRAEGGEPRVSKTASGTYVVTDVAKTAPKKKPAPSHPFAPSDEDMEALAPSEEELAAAEEMERRDREALAKMLDADDALAAAKAEIDRLNAENTTLQGQLIAVQRKCAEFERLLKKEQRYTAKLQRQVSAAQEAERVMEL